MPGGVCNTPIKNLTCPSDSGHGTGYTGGGASAAQPWARGNYAANAGTYCWFRTQTFTTARGQSPGWGFAFEGVNQLWPSGGAMCINYGARMSDILSADGTSQTVLINEVLTGGVLGASDPRGTWALGFPGSSVTGDHRVVAAPMQFSVPNSTLGDTVDAIGIDPAAAAQQGLPFFLRTAGTSPTGQAQSRHNGG